MARRAKGEGGIYWSDSEGLWVGSIDLESGDGHRRRIKRKGKTRQQVAAKLIEVQAALARGDLLTDQREKTGPWLAWWSTDVLPREVAEGTVENYRNVVNYYITPEIGDVPLAKLTPEHVLQMMAALEKRGLSANTVRLARKVLRRAMTDAERFGRINRNPVSLTRSPRKATTKLDDKLDLDETQAVLKAAKDDRLEALAVLALNTGIREGEAIGLRWADVDLDRATLRIRKSTTKTDAGVRTIALPATVVTSLREHRRRQRVERMEAWRWEDTDVVFATTVGTSLDGRNVLRWWYALTERAGVERRRFHATRHTAATHMLNAGVPLEVVSATLGHAGLAITADVYAEVKPALQRTAADAMDGLLGGAAR